ncbi:MAG: HD domain-containing protein, partial [Anaerovorax sp.]
MGVQAKKQVVQSSDAVKIVRDTLRRVDARLLEHGERVAYILLKMLSGSPKYNRQEVGACCILGIFHDIGAYKTDEIDQMIRFETMDVWNHSIYGYLFLKYLSPMKKQAEAILYHHYSYEKFKSLDSDSKDLALLIGLADRVDLVMKSGKEDALVIEMLATDSDKRFDPAHVRLFCEHNKEYDILGNLRSGAFRNEIAKYMENMVFTEVEINQYLCMLAYSVDFRSEYTVMHTIHTVSFSLEIATKMGCTRQELEKIYYGALLHDLGKISIPLEILEYPGKLSYQAMEIMKTHVVITEEIIKGIVDDEICQIAIRHHEKIDGSGYPKGLSGHGLTKSQRIVAVADIISALVGKRSYKEAFPKDKILQIIDQM